MTNAGRRARIARYPDFIDHIALGARAAGRLVQGRFYDYVYGSDDETRASAKTGSS